MTREKADRSETRGDHPFFLFGTGEFMILGGWGQPSPRDHSTQTEIVEFVLPIMGHAAAEYVGFPGGCSGFKARQLFENGVKSGFSMKSGGGSNVLPLEQKAHEI